MPRASSKPVRPISDVSAATEQPAVPRVAGLFVGTSGWAYASWKPGFYPPKLPAKQFLPYYAQQLTSVEVNYTFRALPTEAMLAGWLQAADAGDAAASGNSEAAVPFRFSFKAPEVMTHRRRLRDCEEALAQFVEALAPVERAGRLGLLLFQLPPNFKADPARLAAFLQSPVLARAGLRVAFEFRHASWFAEETYAVLRAHGAALCVAEGEDLVTPEVHTAAGFVCFRKRRSGAYSPEELSAFAHRCLELTQGSAGESPREVFAYFRHEDEPTGPQNAKATLGAAAQEFGR